MKKILVIGDVMLDKYSYGDVRRLNPEGPNPLLNIISEEYVLGGASNVAANISSLYGKCDLIGVVGDDLHFKIFKKLCEEKNIHFFPIIKNGKTITKQRFIENTYKQQLLRVDYEEYNTVEKGEIEFILEHIKFQKYDIIVISDYAKGIIIEELISGLRKENIPIIADVKPKNFSFFDGIYLIKPNFKEFSEIVGKNIKNTNEDIEFFGKKIAQEKSINLVVTRGNKGATLIEKEGKCTHFMTQAKDVFDVTGAGDTFISTVAYGILKNYSLQESISLGNKASGIIVGKVGTAIIGYSELFDLGK